MKKLAFVVVLVALVVGIVFGGLSMASATDNREPWHTNTPHPTCTPKPTPAPNCCVTMWGYSGNVTVPDNGSTSVPYLQPQETATGPRHVVMTLDYREVQVLGQGILVQANIGNSADWVNLWGYAAGLMPAPPGLNDYFITLDFVANNWRIIGVNGGAPTFHVYYSVNVTKGTDL
jgi:hypothetical protein